MKINMNNVGNYGPKYTGVVKDKINIQKPADETAGAEKITHAEKKFFINMYPENKGEIVDYHFYKKSGKMTGVTLGALFDKKG